MLPILRVFLRRGVKRPKQAVRQKEEEEEVIVVGVGVVLVGMEVVFVQVVNFFD